MQKRSLSLLVTVFGVLALGGGLGGCGGGGSGGGGGGGGGTGPGPATSGSGTASSAATSPATSPATTQTTFGIGAGIYDVTGPAGDGKMMGFAKLKQKASGIHMRLWSRAYVIESPQSGKRVVFVSNDLGFTFQSIYQGVIEKLKARYGGLYDETNVMISATHTHSGTGGYSHYGMYNGVSGGYDEQNHIQIIDSIFRAIVRAHDNVAPGVIRIATGELPNVSWNRSQPAYDQNPAAERARYAHSIDKEMTVLRLEDVQGNELGMINWFALHATNIGNQNELITGDNKGYSSYRFEHDKGTDYGPTAFVGAFAQSNEGDVSPNLWGSPDFTHDYERMRIIGDRQYQKAKDLYDGATTTLTAEVDYRQTNVNLAYRDVDAQWTAGAGPKKLGRAAIGMSLLAGAEDGPGLWIFPEGLVYGVNWPKITFVSQDQDEHVEKPIFLVNGKGSPPLTPEVLSFQIFTIGSLAIIAAPFEITTMTGRRIRETVQTELASLGIQHTVIAGLANAYAGYVATREEYAIQHYEGASTHFGPWMANALQQENHRVAEALRTGAALPPGPTPRVITKQNLAYVVDYDTIPGNKSYGEVIKQPNASYRLGETASARFWTGHPRNNLRTMDTFLEVQREVGGNWETVAVDNDPETRFAWKRRVGRRSETTISWEIPAAGTPGTYRLVHHGSCRAQNGSITSFTGVSQSFAVTP